jgi:hypothetical protein
MPHRRLRTKKSNVHERLEAAADDRVASKTATIEQDNGRMDGRVQEIICSVFRRDRSIFPASSPCPDLIRGLSAGIDAFPAARRLRAADGEDKPGHDFEQAVQIDWNSL